MRHALRLLLLPGFLCFGHAALARVPSNDWSDTGRTCRALQDRAADLLREYRDTEGGSNPERGAEILQELANIGRDWATLCQSRYGSITLDPDSKDAVDLGLEEVFDIDAGQPAYAVPDLSVSGPTDRLAPAADPSDAATCDVPEAVVMERPNAGVTTIEARCKALGDALDTCDWLLGDVFVAGVMCDWGWAACGDDLRSACRDAEDEWDALECNTVCGVSTHC